MKRLSAIAYERLRQQYGTTGGADLPPGGAALCRDCAAAAAADAAAVANEGERRAAAARDVAKLEAAGWPEPDDLEAASASFMWVSRSWLHKWVQHVQGSGGGAGGTAAITAHFAPSAPSAALAAGPTAQIVCPHGQLAPDTASRRAAVPEAIWHVVNADAERIYRDAQAREAARQAAKAQKALPAKADVVVVDLSADSPPRKAAPPDGGEASENGGATAENGAGDVAMRDAADDIEAAISRSRAGPSVMTLRVGAGAECAACASSNINERSKLDAQRNQCPLMLKGAPAPAVPGEPLRLLPAPWVAAWRAYHAGGRAQAPAPPGPLAEAVANFVPRCAHGLLLTRLPALACVRGKWQAREAPGAEPSAAAPWRCRWSKTPSTASCACTSTPTAAARTRRR